MMKKNQNETANKQRQKIVTVRNLIERSIKTLFSFPIHRVCRQSASAYVIASYPLYMSYILCQPLRCPRYSLSDRLPPTTPPLLL